MRKQYKGLLNKTEWIAVLNSLLVRFSSKETWPKSEQPRFVLESVPAGAQLLFDEHAVTGVPFA